MNSENANLLKKLVRFLRHKIGQAQGFFYLYWAYNTDKITSLYPDRNLKLRTGFSRVSQH
jgi:hypothetical protein